MISSARQHERSPHPLLPWLAAALSGLLAFLGYVGPGQFYLEWVCLVPLLWAVRGRTPGRAFLVGWVAGIVGHTGGFSWIVSMFRQFADAPLPLALCGLLLLAAANGLVFALWAAGVRMLERGAGWSPLWTAPAVWVAAEKFLPQVFPNYLGASQYKLLPVTQIADVTGILGVTFLVIYANSTVHAVIERTRARAPRPWLPAAVFAGVMAAVLSYGYVRIAAADAEGARAPKMTVGVVQTDRGAGDKFTDQRQFLREHQEMSAELARSERPDLIVWPESVLGIALPGREGRLTESFLAGVHTPLLFGAVLQVKEEGEERLYNSAVLADKDGRIIGTYDKMVLVPFGEYIPFGDVFPMFYSWSPYSGRFWRGRITDPLLLNGHALSVNICYEDIFPGQVRLLMQGGKEGRIPEALFNLTNDSWYGDTIQPLEHLVLASFRSIEHRRPLVRATNTGISAIVDPAGRIVERTPQWKKASLTGSIPLMRGRTVFGRFGDWLGWLCLAITLVGFGRTLRQRKN